MRPRNSPDVNALTIICGGVADRETNHGSQNTTDSLEADIIRVISNISTDLEMRACQRLQSRTEAIITTESDYIE